MPNQSCECLLSRDQQAFTCGGARVSNAPKAVIHRGTRSSGDRCLAYVVARIVLGALRRRLSEATQIAVSIPSGQGSSPNCGCAQIVVGDERAEHPRSRFARTSRSTSSASRQRDLRPCTLMIVQKPHWNGQPRPASKRRSSRHSAERCRAQAADLRRAIRAVCFRRSRFFC
jgi:hypothetical protein